jgi:hypothetical protein
VADLALELKQLEGVLDGLPFENELQGICRAVGVEQRALKKQIEILSNLGMRPVEIAETLGRTQTHINKELAGIRKSGKKGE